MVFLPAFGEEMNRCRALVATQARNFAARGISCTVLDFTGTGDSEGELAQASMEQWEANVHHVIDSRLSECEAPVVLWGFRLGATIALNICSQVSPSPVAAVLWQPVLSGKRFVTQLLRQRVAGLVGKNLPPETTQDIRQKLADGAEVDVGGYLLGGRLIEDIEKLSVDAAQISLGTAVHWFENVDESNVEVSFATQKAISRLSSNGLQVELKMFSDPPIWQLHKRADAPQLLDLTGGLPL